MLGVVLWSDATDRKAVIWCEDQGDLAYVNAPEPLFDDSAFFDAGDLVQFDMDVTQTTRYANNARLVIEKDRPTLVDALLEASVGHVEPRQSAKIVPLFPECSPLEHI